MSIIKLNSVSYTYNKGSSDEIKAVDNISLEINEGEFVALIGRNGSGKSTIARLLNGILTPDKGSVTVFNRLTSDKKELFDIRSRLGVVFQNPDNQMIASIIEDDIAFGPENLGIKSEDIRARVDWALKSVGMYNFKTGTPFRLSGGQKQRVAIAGVLALKPRVMVLDESTSMLDPVGRREVMDVVTALNKENNMTVIMITHFMDEAAKADRIIVMDNGSIVLDGGKEVFLKEEQLTSAGLELPFAMRISNKLNQSGINIKKGITSIEELADNL